MAFLAGMLFPGMATSQSGEQIWKGTCQVCHTEPASGAPQLGDRAAWAPRVAKGREAAVHRSPKRK